MITLSILSAAVLVPLVFAARDPPVFTLDCSTATGYPEACETHCFAAVCSESRKANNFRDVARYLHFAENSGTVQPNLPTAQTTEAKYRRQAIGCGSSYCTDQGADLSCDEFPYASTYDGGLGCLAERYIGNGRTAADLATTGVTHCAKLTDNTAHGRAIKEFYKKIGDRGRFQVGFNENNIDNAPACKLLRQKGKAACSALIATGLYSVVKILPGSTSYCPSRPTLGHARRRRLTEEDLEEHEPRAVEWHSSVDAHGNKLLLPFADGPLKAGTPVFHGIGNGTTFHSVAV